MNPCAVNLYTPRRSGSTFNSHLCISSIENRDPVCSAVISQKEHECHYLYSILFTLPSNKFSIHGSVMFNCPHPFNFNLYSFFPFDFLGNLNDFAAPMTHFPNRDH